MSDCRDELNSLLLEDVGPPYGPHLFGSHDVLSFSLQRLAGASLLVFANKWDLQGSMNDSQIRDVSSQL